jgi:YVTN family beta-propeller protein
MNMKKIMCAMFSLWLFSFSAHSAEFGYVSNADALTQVDLSSGAAKNTDDTFTSLGQSVLSPNGQTLYVIDEGESKVIEIDLTVSPPKATGTTYSVGTDPTAIAITPDGAKLFVTNRSDNTVSVIIIETGEVVDPPINVGTAPAGIAIFKGFAYVVNSGSGNYRKIDTTTYSQDGFTITGSVKPWWIAITPDGAFAYITDLGDTVNPGFVTPANLQTNIIGTQIPVGINPLFIAISPSGAVAYVSNNGAGPPGTVSVLDVSGLPPAAPSTTITVGDAPLGIAFKKDSSRAYVVNTDSATISVITVASSTVTGDPFTLEGAPTYISISDFPLFIPSVIALNPTFGTPFGGTSVEITGENFTNATSVTFGGVAVLSFTINGDESITAISPPGTGTVDVVVTSPDGSSKVSDKSKFTYIFPIPIVARLNPSSGSAGTTVVISGFSFNGVTSVTFGGVQAAFTFNSDNTITAIAPPGTGIVQVIVTTPGGSSSPTLASQFNYGNGGAIGNILPPRHVRGCQSRSVSSSHPTNLIRFKKPRTGNKPVGYRIYRDPALTDLAAKIKAGRKLQFKDRNRVCGVTYSYYIVSVDASGAVSVPASITVKPKK